MATLTDADFVRCVADAPAGVAYESSRSSEDHDQHSAARELAAVLGPHFRRENEIALPPLGLLAALAAGDTPAGMEEALAMTDALRKELPRMLQEHTKIRAATETLRVAAEADKASACQQLAEELTLHARTEEEVLYPAAILVGDVIRGRLSRA